MLKKAVEKAGKEILNKKAQETRKPVSYRLDCARTANGLSHYVMYGDVDEEKALL